MTTTLTLRQIHKIADFVGLVVDIEKSGYNGDDWDQEFVISDKLKLYDEITHKQIYEGMTLHCAEYPEEGFLPLEEHT